MYAVSSSSCCSTRDNVVVMSSWRSSELSYRHRGVWIVIILVVSWWWWYHDRRWVVICARRTSARRTGMTSCRQTAGRQHAGGARRTRFARARTAASKHGHGNAWRATSEGRRATVAWHGGRRWPDIDDILMVDLMSSHLVLDPVGQSILSWIFWYILYMACTRGFWAVVLSDPIYPDLSIKRTCMENAWKIDVHARQADDIDDDIASWSVGTGTASRSDWSVQWSWLYICYCVLFGEMACGMALNGGRCDRRSINVNVINLLSFILRADQLGYHFSVGTSFWYTRWSLHLFRWSFVHLVHLASRAYNGVIDVLLRRTSRWRSMIFITSSFAPAYFQI